MQSVTECLQLGDEARKQGDLALAISYFKASVGIEPGNATCWLRLAATYKKMNDYLNAIESAEHAIQLAKLPEELAKAYTVKAESLRAVEKFTEAECACRRGLEYSPESPDLLFELGFALYDLERHEEAIPVLNHAIQCGRHKPSIAHCHALKGAALENLRRYEESVAEIKVAIELMPEVCAYHAGLGGVLRDMGRHAEAAATYALAISLCKDPALYVLMGDAQLEMDDDEEAERSFREAIAMDSTNHEAHLGLALSLEVKDPEEAKRLLRRAIEFNPEYASAYADLGRIELNQANYSEAEKSIRKSLELIPDDAWVAALLETVLSRSKLQNSHRSDRRT